MRYAATARAEERVIFGFCWLQDKRLINSVPADPSLVMSRS